MGASKEGTMSVREKVHLVLRSFLEEDDPPDTPGDGRRASSSGGNEVNVPRIVGDGDCVAGDTGLGLSPLTTESVSGGCCSGRTGDNKVGSGGEKSGFPLSRNCEGVTKSTKVRTSGGTDSSLGHDGVRSLEEFVVGESESQVFLLRELLAGQLRLIQSLQKRLSSAETTAERLRTENEQLQKELKDEHQQNAEFRMQNERIIQSKDDRIRELEAELAVAKTRKPTEEKETCMTPPPPSSSLPPPHYQSSKRNAVICDDEFLNMDDDYPGLSTPKRAKLTSGQPETVTDNNFLPPPQSRKSYLSSSSYLHHPHNPQRRSDSPPRLSPAVTPKSTPNNISSGRPRDIKSFLGDEMNEDAPIGAPDEFQDELESINRRTLPNSPGQVKERSSADNHVSGDQFPNSYSPRAQHSLYTDHTSSPYSPAFSQPPFTKSRHTRFTFPDSSGKKRYQNSGSSFLPIKSRSQQQHATPSDFPYSKGNCTSNNFKNFSQQAIRNRSNNFLNLSRPPPKKAPVIIVPPPQSQNTQQPTSSAHFRSLAGTAAAATASSSSKAFQYTQHHLYHPSEEDQAALVPSITPPAVKKRKVGRPPGSYKSKGVVSKSSLSSLFSSPSSSTPGTPQQSGQLPNGTITSQEQPIPPPPQRFSQRGRLLKPNRARYSPDPDVSVNTSREKYMTTKRGYFVGEPFVQTSYPGEEDQTGGLLGPDESGFQFSTPPPTVGPLMEYEPYVLPGPESETSKSKTEGFDEGNNSMAESGAFVEVPKWRVNDIASIPESELSPEDDMSDEAFLKRHQKLEAKEKQRKRWDSQRMREESYLERLKRKQEERERQKELRRQQRKRNKARNGASEEESVTPSVEDIKAVHIGTDLPVGAFGHPLPLVEKVDFNLMWNITAVTLETVPTPPPQQQQQQQQQQAKNEESSGNSDKDSPKAGTTPVHNPLEACSNVPSPSTTPTVPLSLSSPSSSSLSLPSIPSPGASPSPPIIFPVYDDTNEVECTLDQCENEAKKDQCLIDDGDTETLGDQDLIIVYEGTNEEMEPPPGEDDDECSPASPIFTVDLTDYVNSSESEEMDNDEDDEKGNKESEDIIIGGGGETCDTTTDPVAAIPSISIPLQSPPSSTSTSTLSSSLVPPTESELPPELPAPPADTSSALTTSTIESKPRNSTVVHIPKMMSFPPSVSTALASSTLASQSSRLSSSSSTVSKTSITFFIPNNPLAPRRSSAPNAIKAGSSTPAAPSRPECCKDS